MISLKRIFRPSGNKFHVFFEEVAGNLAVMSNMFLAAVYEPDLEIRKSLLVQFAELKASNDVLTHRLFNELAKNFITPFDREDIYSLITILDEIADYMYATIRQLKTYNIEHIPQPTKNVATNLHIIIKQLAEGVCRLKDKRTLEQLYPLCMEIKKATDLCTSITDAAISRVYADEQDPYDVIKKLDHYEMVHTILERCYNATSVIESVIVKYA